ncbi:MAG: hypothetical protein EA402_03410 [Planctomycetota bacterium]|nr:MAG: hypothetical protein EA402_03410 [Planctomycetota bacterium]
MPTDQWKEGRQGAASLCYGILTPAQWPWVVEHHRRVGIRASVAASIEPELQERLLERHWDLGATVEHALSLPLPLELGPAQAAIEAVVQAKQWRVWTVHAETLVGLGQEGHQQLLSWLGDHHARIWCAPQRDIAAWLAS